MEELQGMIPEELKETLYYYVLVVFGIRTIIWLLFANTIRKTLLLMDKENRCITPNQVWFVAMPLFNIYWNFEVVKRLSYSLNNEFFDRKLAAEERPGMKSGMLYVWTFLAVNIPFPPFILMTAGLLNLFYFISYWIRVSQFKTLLMEHNLYKAEKEQEDQNL